MRSVPGDVPDHDTQVRSVHTLASAEEQHVAQALGKSFSKLILQMFY